MPRDKRLYMTFPIDFHRHPKLLRQPVEVRWAFVEMNGEARIADNDGVFEAEEAEFLWGRDILDALVTSHPSRPLVERIDGGYRIREYGEHQQTRADREARSLTNSENGRKGGRPRKNRPETESVTTGNRTEPAETQSQSQSQSQRQSDLTDITNDTQSSPESNARTSGLEVDQFTRQRAKAAGIKDLPKLHGLLSRAVDGPLSARAAIELAEAILKRSKDPNVRNVDAYVATSCRNSPAEIRWDYDRLDLGA